MAAKNKCLAQSNKSDTEGKATKKRLPIMLGAVYISYLNLR